MMRKLNGIMYGITVPNVYKKLGEPFKIVKTSENSSILLFRRKRLFGRTETIKVTITENVVSNVTQSIEKRVRLESNNWEI